MQHPPSGRAKQRNLVSALYFGLLFPLLLFASRGQASTLLAGSGTNACTLQLNFSSGENISFTYRFEGATIRAQTALENIIAETGGALVSTGYLLDFSSALSLLSAPPTGLVVHYQSSTNYPDPYINGILWAPTGAANGDYLSDFEWWQIWVQGPAFLEQPYNYPTTAPLSLNSDSGWVSPTASGLKDITLGNGASFGLVYGSAAAPSSASSGTPPAPVVHSSRILTGNQLEMTFETVPNVSYVLKSKSTLLSTGWNSVTTLVATSTMTTFTVPMNHPAGHEFFRLEIAP